jgi:hypothetical protein
MAATESPVVAVAAALAQKILARPEQVVLVVMVSQLWCPYEPD